MSRRQTDLDAALADIALIRQRMNDGAMFQGLGPAVVLATSAIAVMVAAAQSFWPGALASSPAVFAAVWIAAAAISAILLLIEMRARSARAQTGLADAAVWSAARRFAPAAAAGAALTLGALLARPETLPLLPGLWQVCVGLGAFAAAPLLPPGMRLVAAWYMLCGVLTFSVGDIEGPLAPWLMGAPFAIGQALAAWSLAAARMENADERL